MIQRTETVPPAIRPMIRKPPQPCIGDSFSGAEPGTGDILRTAPCPHITVMSQDLRVTTGLVPTRENAPPGIALSEEDREALRQAVRALESPSFAARLSALAGRPIEFLGQALPQAASEAVSRATEAALTRALRYALTTIPKETVDPETRLHRALAILSGAMGGALGISAVLAELPLSTTIMLRAIARIAQSEGESLEDPETALACL